MKAALDEIHFKRSQPLDGGSDGQDLMETWPRKETKVGIQKL